MYLARKRVGPRTYYFLRESYFEDGLWRSRDLFSLGAHPEKYIIYPGGNGFYIDPCIEESLAEQGVKTDQMELEKIFMPFLDPHIRRLIEDFSHGFQPKERLPRKEQLRRQEGYHLFDKRRLLFLRFGGTNLDPLLRRPLPFLNVLHAKSRDEIEQHIMNAESRLRPRETLAYIYTAFGLAQRFRPRLTRHIPEAQIMEQLDKFFLEEVCHVAQDESWRMGLDEEIVLRDYLSRYVIMYFDRLEAQRSFFEEHQARMMRQHYQAARSAVARAAAVFGVSEEELLQMGKEEIIRLFRRRAREAHPDQGGAHEDFIRLHKLFEELMEARGWRR